MEASILETYLLKRRIDHLVRDLRIVTTRKKRSKARQPRLGHVDRIERRDDYLYLCVPRRRWRKLFRQLRKARLNPIPWTSHDVSCLALIVAAADPCNEGEGICLILLHRLGEHREAGTYEEAEPDAASLPGLSGRSADEVLELESAVSIQVSQIDRLRSPPVTLGDWRRCFWLTRICHVTL